ncbi:hypothetical protein FPE01S_03_07060 [Flavihumibacter petaseus NBRC 106054]|uniref:Uncharacterized protein n=1 Tax=Flavihumibacter petaseus NBRC 106054 TaxID=1220578 RepID=A0A0E9N3V8_9BACT|nr:hypothetical protein FPE01S_03_07060 [Flavihumibacter petaseus NBRC 106054]
MTLASAVACQQPIPADNNTPSQATATKHPNCDGRQSIQPISNTASFERPSTILLIRLERQDAPVLIDNYNVTESDNARPLVVENMVIDSDTLVPAFLREEALTDNGDDIRTRLFMAN